MIYELKNQNEKLLGKASLLNCPGVLFIKLIRLKFNLHLKWMNYRTVVVLKQ